MEKEMKIEEIFRKFPLFSFSYVVVVRYLSLLVALCLCVYLWQTYAYFIKLYVVGNVSN